MFLDACPHRPRRKLPGKGDEIFSGIRCPRRDVDKRGDLRIRPCFAEDRTTPRVGNQHGRAVLLRQYAARLGDGILERGQRILYRGDLFYFLFFSARRSDAELMQKRRPVGAGPSGNT